MQRITPRARAEQVYTDFREGIMANTQPCIVDMLEEAIISMQAEKVPPCEEHPKYKGKSKPRTSCENCWRYYLSLKDYKVQGTTKAAIIREVVSEKDTTDEP